MKTGNKKEKLPNGWTLEENDEYLQMMSDMKVIQEMWRERILSKEQPPTTAEFIETIVDMLHITSKEKPAARKIKCNKSGFWQCLTCQFRLVG